MKKIKVVLIGAGDRGMIYTNVMAEEPDKFEVIAVAEPVDCRREEVKKKHSIPDDRCFRDWKDLLALGKIADLAIVATQDSMHYAPAMEAISLKYHVMLEKPVSPSPMECLNIEKHARECGVHVIVCHVLRYTPMFRKIKDVLDEGTLGQIVTINHEECVGNIHQSHSYVRGNWGNSKKSSCMLLAKSCHDLDLLQWLIGKKCRKIQSFGSLSYFKEQNAPKGAPSYCMDGCQAGDTCPYNAEKLYLDKKNIGIRTACTKQINPTDEMVKLALKTTQYGKCVYKCDNDVVDHQTVNMLFEDDVTATFTMSAFNKGGRYIHIMGTKGELHAALDENDPIRIFDFETRQESQIPVVVEDRVGNGHSGGDRGIVEALYDYLNDCYLGCSISDISVSVHNHLMVFAAEESRANNTVVDMQNYISNLLEK